MTTLKCRQCGLVNPFGTLHCKRCEFDLNASGNQPAPGETYQESRPIGQQSGRRQIRDSLSNVCGICGTIGDVKVTSFKRTYTPPWVYIFLPIGLLIALIIATIVRVKHTLTLPICPICTRRRSLAGIVSFVSLVSCVVLILFAIVAGLATKSWPVFLGVAAITIAIAYFAEKYDRSVNPRYIKFTKKRVEIEVPGHGSVVMFDLASQQAGNEFY